MKFNRKFKWLRILFMLLAVLFLIMLGVVHYYHGSGYLAPSASRQPHWERAADAKIVRQARRMEMRENHDSNGFFSGVYDFVRHLIFSRSERERVVVRQQQPKQVVVQKQGSANSNNRSQPNVNGAIATPANQGHLDRDATQDQASAAASLGAHSKVGARLVLGAVSASRSHADPLHTPSAASKPSSPANVAVAPNTPSASSKPSSPADAAALAAKAVRVTLVSTMSIYGYATAVGNLQARQQVHIAPEIAGRLLQLAVKDGAWVQKGQLIAQLDDRVYVANLNLAKSALVLSRNTYQRYLKLAPQGGVSQLQLQQVREKYQQAQAKVAANEAYLQQTQLRAPFAGYVGRHLLTVGSYVDKGAVITTLVNRSHMQVVYLLPEQYRSEIQLGQSVVVHLQQGAALGSNAAVGPQRLTGRVSYIAPQADQSTGSIMLQATLVNPDQQLLPGALVEVQQQVIQAKDAVVVPETSILPTLNGMLVYIVEHGKASARLVTLGQRHGYWVQVLTGVKPGEVIVTGGLSQLKDGMPVHILSVPLHPKSVGR